VGYEERHLGNDAASGKRCLGKHRTDAACIERMRYPASKERLLNGCLIEMTLVFSPAWVPAQDTWAWHSKILCCRCIRESLW